MKFLITIALAAFLTVLAAPAVLAGEDKDEAQEVPKKCGTTWGGIKNIYNQGDDQAARCK